MSSEHGVTGLERLLIVRLSAMGDVIHTLPAVQALRYAFPNAIIDWLIEERWTELLCAPGTPRRGPRSAGRPLVDWVHVVRLAGWRKSLFEMPTIEQIARLKTVMAQLESWRDEFRQQNRQCLSQRV